MKFWPFPILRNYETDRALTQLVLSFAADETLRIDGTGEHRMQVTTNTLGTLQFWNVNRFYAWMSEGAWRPPQWAERPDFIWKDAMPSRYAMRQMRLALQRAAAREIGALQRSGDDMASTIQKIKEAA